MRIASPVVVSGVLALAACHSSEPANSPDLRVEDLATYVVSCPPRPTPDLTASSLGSEQQLRGYLGATQVVAFRFPLAAGELAESIVDQRRGDLVLCLYDEGGRILLAVDRPTGVEQPEDLPWSAAASGMYRLEVRGLEGGAPTEFSIRLNVSRSPTEEQLARTAASLVTHNAEELRRNPDPRAAALAERLYQESLAAWRRLDDRRAEGDLLYRLGELQRLRLRNAEAAVGSLERAVPLLSESGLRFSEAKACMALGSALLELNRAADAEQRFLRAVELFATPADLRRQATALNELAYSFQLQGRFEDAILRYGEALQRWRAAQEPGYEATSLHNRGLVYSTIGKYEEARQDLSAAQRLREESPQTAENSRYLAATLSAIGGTYLFEGRLHEALAYLERALPLRRALGDRHGEAVTLGGIGRTLQHLGRITEAIERQRQAVQIFAGLSHHEWEKTRALYNLGLCLFEDKRSQEAASIFQQSLTGARGTGDLQLEIATLSALARLRRDDGDPLEAWALLQQGLNRIEALRDGVSTFDLRASLLATQQESFDLAVDVLMELDHSDPEHQFRHLALEVAERGRARALLDLVAESGIEVRQEAPPALVVRKRELWEAIRSRQLIIESEQSAVLGMDLARSDPGIRALLREAGEIELAIRKASPSFRELAPIKPLRAHEIQARVLDPDTLLLYYKLGRNQSFLWVVSSESIDSFRLRPRYELEALARQAHLLISSPDAQTNQAQADLTLARLSDDLLHPVLDRSRGKRLLIVTEGALQYIPFAVLPIPADRGGPAVPLAVRNDIVNIPSASTLAALLVRRAETRRTPHRLAILADPVFRSDDARVVGAPGAQHERKPSAASDRWAQPPIRTYERLPFSRLEAEAIATSVRHSDVLRLLDFDASKEAIVSRRVGGYHVLHFATHGEVNPIQPELSRLVLSLVDRQGRPRDGYLYSREISDLELDADLVVLSACESGLGQETPGEGLIGLPQAFFFAGAQRVVVSLWKVDDKATSSLMARFYRHLIGEGMNPGAALRTAQVEQWKEQPWPYYWSGFILQGSWR